MESAIILERSYLLVLGETMITHTCHTWPLNYTVLNNTLYTG